MIVVDSSVWISNIRREDTPEVRRLREFRRSVVIAGDIVVLEILRGVQNETEAMRQEERFRAYGITPMLSPQIALAAAANYRRLRALGITINKVPDLIIATFCIAHGHHLLHRDRDFRPFEELLGLRVVR